MASQDSTVKHSAGVRELENQASRSVNTVHKQAHLSRALAELKVLAHQVAAAWKSPKSGLELVDEQRR